MPLVDVPYASRVEDRVQRLAEALPHAVAAAVACPEEPYDGSLQSGDVEVRFRPQSPHDLCGLDIVVEIRSKWFASRDRTRQDRCDQLCATIVEAAGTPSVGVYLSLPVAAWAQGE